MENSLYILIPLSVLLVFVIGLIFRWSVKSGQFDDLEGPGFRILMDDDSSPSASDKTEPKDEEINTLV
ncbi:cbb3-type cytochrome oxidase assembly protein CcoS [Uliginosibacterium sp. 31-16]|uniref:cbb3-type cytochrome oxidase assembly protein CcoS n=1 Tax=Uliginosibacterium sp. 31-16 TaxID=3068315 RepID=UPI00273FB459|nr:cbb3-type cytochrome oxidase assembly protein CcoS [Uliginosibacterium sp. 31-16]MDP5240132.1 cbb3-type cytochrome oxidase assembly protein CcoS [Uliginosibacterium sp. 31-16]